MEEICNQHQIKSRNIWDGISSLVVYYFGKSLSNPSKMKHETWSIQKFGLEFRGRFHLTAIDGWTWVEVACFQINQGCKPETLSWEALWKQTLFLGHNAWISKPISTVDSSQQGGKLWTSFENTLKTLGECQWELIGVISFIYHITIIESTCTASLIPTKLKS